jgi:alpha-glucosidase
MKKVIALPLLFFFLGNLLAQDSLRLTLLNNEHWWGGSSNYGHFMPFHEKEYAANLYGDRSVNQSAPLFISSAGRWVWSDEPFAYRFIKDTLIINKAHGKIQNGQAGNSLAAAYTFVSKTFFPTSGKWIDSLLVKSPQYNLWIELGYHPNQKAVLNYANGVLKNNYPPGVLMIDDNWTDYYGQFDFNRDRFPDAAALIDSLHQKGFKVMVWICPFISPDSETFRELMQKRLLLLDNGGDTTMTWNDKRAKPLITYWWNGFSATLDLSNPAGQQWLKDKLHWLQRTYGIDGFKFDAGEPHYYDFPNLLSFKKSSPNEHCMYWAQIGLDFPFNEYRAMWKMGGQPLGERLNDKAHTWSDLQTLIPNTFAQQLLGYTFTCPDIIGGGFLASFAPGKKIDQQLVVRSAQCHALMPMMQFSAAPWRVLDAANEQAVHKAVMLRQHYLDYIMEVLRQSAATGEPALRPLEFNFPNQGYAAVQDQFMLGTRLMVAPVVTSSNTRMVLVPKGKWRFRGSVIKGPLKQTIDVAPDELPVYEKVD